MAIFQPKTWDINSVPTAEDFNRIEKGLKDLAPVKLWSGSLVATDDTFTLSEPPHKFRALRFVIQLSGGAFPIVKTIDFDVPPDATGQYSCSTSRPSNFADLYVYSYSVIVNIERETGEGVVVTKRRNVIVGGTAANIVADDTNISDVILTSIYGIDRIDD